MSEPHIDELLQRCASLPYGPQLDELLDQALDWAEQAQDAQAEYRVRLLQADACAMSGDSTGLLGNFRWCLDRYDQDPQAYPSDPGDGADLLWQYKWMAAVLSADPQIPAAEIHGLLDEMHGHYLRAGLGGSAVLTARFEVAFANGWMDQAAALYAKIGKQDEDGYSHCEACIRSLQMCYLFATGAREQGLELLEELLAHDFSCGQEPANAIGAALIELLRAGRVKETKDLHVRSYQVCRRDPDNLGLVAHHLHYLVATGNLSRALSIAERHLPWLAHDPMAQREHLAFLSALGLLCGKLTESGLGEVRLRGSQEAPLAEFFGHHEQPVRLDVLGPLAWRAAWELAARFDERNVNDWTTRRVQAVADLATEHWELSWEEDAWLPRHRPAPVPERAGEFLRRARESGSCGATERALADIMLGLAGGPPPDVAAGLHQLALVLELGAGNEQRARTHLRGYLLALSRAGYGPLALLLAEYGLSIHRDGTPEQLSALLHAQQTGSPDLATEVYVGTWLTHAQMRHDQFDQAQASCAAILPRALELTRCHAGNDVRDWLLHNLYSVRIVLASTAQGVRQLEPLVLAWRKYNPTDTSLAQVQFFLAQLLSQGPGAEVGLDYAERALSVFAAFQDRDRAIAAADHTATVLCEAGQLDRAKERLRFGLHQAELAESSERPALLFRLAQLHVESGETFEALDYLMLLLEDAHQLAAGEHAEIHDLMGEAHALGEQFQDAAQNWEQATALFAATANPVRELQTAEKLVNIYLLTGMFDEAQELAERLVPLGQALQEAQGITPALNALMLLATVQEATGEGDTAGSFTSATQLAAEHGQTQLQAQIVVKHAQWAGGAEDYAQAVSLMLQAAQLFEEAGQESNAAQGIGAAASYLAKDARHEEAVLLFDQSLQHSIEDPAAERTLRLRLAESLAALGEPDRARVQRERADRLEG